MTTPTPQLLNRICIDLKDDTNGFEKQKNPMPDTKCRGSSVHIIYTKFPPPPVEPLLAVHINLL